MPVNEPALVPNVEAGPNAGNVYAVRVFDRRFVGVVLQSHGVKDCPAVIDEMYVVPGHKPEHTRAFQTLAIHGNMA